MKFGEFMFGCVESVVGILFGGGNGFIGVESISAENAWKRRAARKVDDAQVQAAVDALVLTVAYDGTVTSGEALALSNETGEIAEARGIDANSLREMISRARMTVDAALGTVSLRDDAERARKEGAAKLVAKIGATMTHRTVREIVFRTVVRIARGSSANPESHEELLREFARSFDLDFDEDG